MQELIQNNLTIVLAGGVFVLSLIMLIIMLSSRKETEEPIEDYDMGNTKPLTFTAGGSGTNFVQPGFNNLPQQNNSNFAMDMSRPVQTIPQMQTPIAPQQQVPMQAPVQRAPVEPVFNNQNIAPANPIDMKPIDFGISLDQPMANPTMPSQPLTQPMSAPVAPPMQAPSQTIPTQSTSDYFDINQPIMNAPIQESPMSAPMNSAPMSTPMQTAPVMQPPVAQVQPQPFVAQQQPVVAPVQVNEPPITNTAVNRPAPIQQEPVFETVIPQSQPVTQPAANPSPVNDFDLPPV